VDAVAVTLTAVEHVGCGNSDYIIDVVGYVATS